MSDTPTTDVLDRASRFGWQALATLTSLVIAWSAVRGVRSGYTPAGDNAILELRARDVFTSNHPLLGSGSSASISSGIDVNHPGPLLFDLMAIPIKLFGTNAGIALSIATLNIAVVWLIGVVLSRSLGSTVAFVGQVVTAGIAWAMGSELLYDPWQPNVLVLSFWLVLCSVWVVAAGHTAWLPLAAGFGSFAMQTHLSYLMLVPILLAFAIVRVALAARRDDESPVERLRTPVLWSGVVILVLWAQPLVEQLFGSGQGNISRIVIAGTGGGDATTVENTTTGLSLGLRLLGSVLALPPFWGRPGFDDSIPTSTFASTADGPEIVLQGPVASLPVALLGLAVLAVMVGAAWWMVRRQGRDDLVAGFETFLVALAVATVTLIITPVDILGLSPHKLRWLWMVGAFVTLLLALAALTLVTGRNRRIGLGGLGAVGLLAVAFTFPTYAAASGPMDARITFDAVESLRNQVAEYVQEHPDATDRVVFDSGGIGFAEPYTSPVLAELAEQGVDFVVPEPSFPRQVGEGRRADGDPTRPTIFLRVGEDATFAPGAERIAFHDGERTNWSVNDITDRAVAVFISFPPETGAEAEVDR